VADLVTRLKVGNQAGFRLDKLMEIGL